MFKCEVSLLPGQLRLHGETLYQTEYSESQTKCGQINIQVRYVLDLLVSISLADDGLSDAEMSQLTPSPPLPSHFLQTVELTQIVSLSQISSESLLLYIAFRTKPKSPASSNLLLRASPTPKVTRCPALSGERNKNSSLEPTLPGIPPGTPKSFLRCSVALQVLLRSVYPPHQFCALKTLAWEGGPFPVLLHFYPGEPLPAIMQLCINFRSVIVTTDICLAKEKKMYRACQQLNISK